MKILFSAGELDEELNANTKIVLQLAEYMAQQGHTVAVSGICYYRPCDEKANGVLLKKFAAPKAIAKASEAFEDFISKGDRNALRPQFIKKHPLKSVFLALRYNGAYIEKTEQHLFIKKLKRFVNDFKPDVMVLPYKPINSFEKVVGSDISVPMVAYQMDPWGLHRLDNPDGDAAVMEKECAAFRKAEKIFTTPVLLRQYSENELYKKYTDKMIAVDFPNVKNHNAVCDSAAEESCKVTEKTAAKSAIDFDGGYINILFGGVVADSFRNPQYALEALAPLFENGEKIRAYFMGVNNSAVLDDYIGKYPHNVFFKDKVSADVALATMEKADVLFNISNKIDNQVPSKIFDYFAMGKPILNLQQLENCPAAEYFEKYPLVYTLKQWENADTESLEEFFKNAKGKKVDFDTVKGIYKTATVDFVAESMLTEFEKL
ncbi:MAG: hypothetical protein IJ339_04055 [Oscillospiraceae bacterium]|nr:hypothetical protein [Oscillospiraceae bacterium]